MPKTAQRIVPSFLFAGLAALGACQPSQVTGGEGLGSNNQKPSFADFEANTYQGPDGIYVVNGDEPVENEKQLREFYARVWPDDGALAVLNSGGSDAKWDAQQKKNLTYCVSRASFGGNHAKIVAAMAQATGEWEKAADVKFVHVSSLDGNCTPQQTGVLFDVNQATGQPFLARAFFPGNSRRTRNVVVDTSSFGRLGSITLAGIIRHELGHVLGFRHEHTRPEAGTCFEDNAFRPLTGYDKASVMHYPQCNGIGGRDLSLTASDKAGAAALYGAPVGGGGGNPPPPPPPPPTQTVDITEGFVEFGDTIFFEPIAIKAGTRLVVKMTGDGDADLYVRFNLQPTEFRFNCRPFLDDSNETCSLDVPTGAQTAHIAVDGFEASTFRLETTFTKP